MTPLSRWVHAGGDKHRALDLPALFANITIDNINSRIVFTRPLKLTACKRDSSQVKKKREKQRLHFQHELKKASQVREEETLYSLFNTFKFPYFCVF